MPNTDTTRTRAAARKPGAPRSHHLLLALVGMVVAVLALAPSLALALPAERHYEMVSPVFKNGFGATAIEAVSPNGESVAYYSGGAFNGIPTGLTESSTAFVDYLARRGASGWSTSPLPAPASLIADRAQMDLSPSLETELEIGNPGPDSQNYLPAEDLFVHPTALPDTPAGWEPPSVIEEEAKGLFTLGEVAATVDFCHVLLHTSGSAALLKQADGTVDQVYEFDRGCHGEQASLALVGVNNKDELIEHGCQMGIGTGPYDFLGGNAQDTFNALSSDGGEVFFTDCVSGPNSPHQLFARLGGSRTIEVSKPLAPACEAGGVAGEVPCAGALERASAEFAGASENGSRVFFTAPLNTGQAPLVPGDADASNNLYMASIGCPHGGSECPAAEREVISLAEVSHDPNGGAADVRGVVRVAPDGQRAYFVAGGDLLSAAQQAALEVQGRPVPRVGADNLYVYDDAGAGTVVFIGDLCYGAELSGSVEDTRCPAGLTEPEKGYSTGGTNDTSLWLGSEGNEAQTAGEDGRFLVFATYARLSADDTSSAKQVYRYDAQTGSLERVSIGEAGYDSNGNGGLFGSSILPGDRAGRISPVRDQHELNKRAVSEDGSRIVFSSAEALSPAATNGLSNAYEWHENAGGVGGAVSLVSSGNGSEDPVSDVVISAEGDDVFFITSQGLVAQDIDGAPDIYDARIGGGFASAPAETRPCEGDGCQGPLTNPAPLLVAGSVVQAPGQNVASPTLVATKMKAKPKCKRGFSRDRAGKCVKVKRKARKSTAMRRANSKPSGGGKS
jgi:hypothetical protein